MAYILAVGGELNGPVIGAIFTIVGFAAFGKHPRNIVPIMAGVFLGSLAKPWSADDPSILLAALFGTTLAPIAGRFGWHWGVVAGFVHSSAALSVGPVHAGLNLYNNGFAAGHRRRRARAGHHRHPVPHPAGARTAGTVGRGAARRRKPAGSAPSGCHAPPAPRLRRSRTRNPESALRRARRDT